MQKILRNKILNAPNKLISYAEFIATALYHPEHGYYMKPTEKIGRSGDFFTTSNVADIYGRLVARWYGGLVKEYNMPPYICELGAGTGRFAQAFLDEWHQNQTTPIHYTILETSPYHQELQREKIEFNSRVKQVLSLEEIRNFNGLIFSNELFDALPVHVVQKSDGKMMEVMIGFDNESFVERALPLENRKIVEFLSENNIYLNEGQRIEVPLKMGEIIKNISTVLNKGLIVTVDYGYTQEDWMEPARKDGSLRGYFKHNLVRSILENPGDMDITSHVHLDAFIREGEQNGLDFVAMLRQDEFFLGIGILEELTNHYDPNPFSETGKRNRAIRSLIMPGGISSAFHVILQQKGLQYKKEELIKHGI